MMNKGFMTVLVSLIVAHSCQSIAPDLNKENRPSMAAKEQQVLNLQERLQKVQQQSSASLDSLLLARELDAKLLQFKKRLNDFWYETDFARYRDQVRMLEKRVAAELGKH